MARFRLLALVALVATALAASAADDAAHALDGRAFRIDERYEDRQGSSAAVIAFADGAFRDAGDDARGAYRCEPIEGGWRFTARIQSVVRATACDGLSDLVAMKVIESQFGGGGAMASATAKSAVRAGATTIAAYEGTVRGDAIEGRVAWTIDGAASGAAAFSGSATALPDKPAPDITWSYRLYGEGRDTVLDLDGVRLVFAGKPYSGRGSGTLAVSSPRPEAGSGSSGAAGDPDRFAHHSHDGGCELTYAGHALLISEAATRLAIDGAKPVALDHGKPTVVVPAKGPARVASVEKPPKPGPLDGRRYRVEFIVDGERRADVLTFADAAVRMPGAESVRVAYAAKPARGGMAWTASGEEPAAAGPDPFGDARLGVTLTGTIDGDAIAGSGAFTVGAKRVLSFTFTGAREATGR